MENRDTLSTKLPGPIVLQDVTIDLGSGLSTDFTLGAWRPANTHAANVFAQLAANPRAGEVVFADDYDTEGVMHVNRWPEMGS